MSWSNYPTPIPQVRLSPSRLCRVYGFVPPGETRPRVMVGRVITPGPLTASSIVRLHAAGGRITATASAGTLQFT